MKANRRISNTEYPMSKSEPSPCCGYLFDIPRFSGAHAGGEERTQQVLIFPDEWPLRYRGRAPTAPSVFATHQPGRRRRIPRIPRYPRRVRRRPIFVAFPLSHSCTSVRKRRGLPSGMAHCKTQRRSLATPKRYRPSAIGRSETTPLPSLFLVSRVTSHHSASARAPPE
jgi:hypothetical protein